MRRDPRTLAYALLIVGVLLLANSGFFGALPGFLRTMALLGLGAALWLGPTHLTLGWRVAGFGGVFLFALLTSDTFAGVVALGFPALGFALAYLTDRRRWWTIIPAGILASVAILITLEVLFSWNATPVLFLGFAATFTTLYLLSPQRGGQRWALLPAVVFIALTVLVNDPGSGFSSALPLLFIGAGVLMLWWWQRDPKSK